MKNSMLAISSVATAIALFLPLSCADDIVTGTASMLRARHLEGQGRPSSVLQEGATLDLFNKEDRMEMMDNMKAAAEVSPDPHSRLLETDGSLGSRCRNDDVCKGSGAEDTLVCVAGRCLPDTENGCLATATAKFLGTFDADAWKASVFEEAGVTQEDLMKAAVSAGGYKAFQETSAYQALMAAGESLLPPELFDLQAAVNVCDIGIAKAAEGTESRVTPGTTVYMGLHLELSVIADIAASFFWSLGNDQDTWPTCFIRGTFGLEAGLGAEASVLLGFAFTGKNEEILEGSIITDVDGGLGLKAGLAVVANLNGVTSLEFTLGVGAGGGLGVGYGITAACCEREDAPAPDPTPVVCPTQLNLGLLRELPASPEVATIYNSITSASGVFVVFNGDDTSCAANTMCTTEHDAVCTVTSGSTTDITTLPVVSEFEGRSDFGGGGCCDNDSCAYSLIESEPFRAFAGQDVSFDFFATGGDDWYEVALVVFQGSGPATTSTPVVGVKVFRGDQLSTAIIEKIAVPSDGDYFLGFFTGTFDKSGRRGVGAKLTIEGFSCG